VLQRLADEVFSFFASAIPDVCSQPSEERRLADETLEAERLAVRKHLSEQQRLADDAIEAKRLAVRKP